MQEGITFGTGVEKSSSATVVHGQGWWQQLSVALHPRIEDKGSCL